MKVLSIHVDESGDFGNYSTKFAPHYIFTMVFHDQDEDLKQHIKMLDKEMANLGFFNHVVHCGPLIRKEEAYCNLLPNERRAVFTKMFYFAKKAPITYRTFVIERKECPDDTTLDARIRLILSRFIEEHLAYFQSFGKVILYYDNGQAKLGKCLRETYQEKVNSFERKMDVKPYKYKLLQVADMLCTMKLLEIKCDSNDLTKSELAVFHSRRDLKKEFLKKIKEKEF